MGRTGTVGTTIQGSIFYNLPRKCPPRLGGGGQKMTVPVENKRGKNKNLKINERKRGEKR